MAVTRVMFIRTGETDWNRIGRWQGWVAVPLNGHGKQQAKRLGTFLLDAGIDALYSSDLGRAKQTASIISGIVHVKPNFDARLRERSTGEWQGLTIEEIIAWYPESYSVYVDNPENVTVPGGESRADVIARMREAFDEIVALDHEIIAIISHSTAIRGLLDALIADCDYYEMQFANISVTTIARDEESDGWRFISRNDVSHLEGMEAKTMPELEK